MTTARETLQEPKATDEALAEFTAVLQGLLNNIFEELPVESDFSEIEILLGQNWIDGLPVYRRVWTGTTATAATTIVPSGAVFDTVISARIRLVSTTGDFVGSDSNYSTLADLEVTVDSQNNLILSHSDVSLQGVNYIVILEYTKE